MPTTPGVKTTRGHSVKVPGRSQRTYRQGRQPTTRSASGGLRCSPPRPKGGKCERMHLSDTQTSLSNWQACLQPPDIQDVHVGNLAQDRLKSGTELNSVY